MTGNIMRVPPAITPSLHEDRNGSTGLKALAVLLVVLIAGVGSWTYLSGSGSEGHEKGSASPDSLLEVTSESISPATMGTTNTSKPVVVASTESIFYPLIATPIAVKYVQGAHISGGPGAGANYTRVAVPLLVTDKTTSTAVVRFIQTYSLPDTPEGVVIGDKGTLNLKEIVEINGDSPEAISREAASKFWKASDAVVIIRGNQDGYDRGVVGAVLASYLDIPVIVTDHHDLSSRTAKVLDDLGVDYSIVLGDAEGYGKVVRPKTVEDIEDITISIVRERLGMEINYIALANPMDTVEPEVVDSITPSGEGYSGEITNSDAAAYPGAAPPVPNDAPELFFTIPKDYIYANVKIDVKMDVSMVQNADLSGERIYVYVGVDSDHDGVMDGDDDNPTDHLQFFGGSPAYEYIRENPNDPSSRPLTAHFYTEIPFFVDMGEHAMQLLAKLPTAYSTDYTSTYSVHIEIDKLKEPNYPLMPGLSGMASYLAAYRGGVVLAKPEYELYENVGYIGCSGCGVPAANPDVLGAANNESIDVKHDLNRLLAKLAGLPLDYSKGLKERNEEILNLAKYYTDKNAKGDYTSLGIIADTNMVPQYYYISKGQGDATEGFGIPGDNIYADIDSHEKDAPYEVDASNPSMELAVGRVDGWDVQDVSALLGRTFFYNQIIDKFIGHRVEYSSGKIIDLSWKDSAMTSFGSLPPVESASSVTTKLDEMFYSAGFTSDSNRDQEQARRQWQGAIPMTATPDGAETALNSYLKTYEVYQRSNFIMFCAHGFYYWYVPTAQEGLASPYVPAVYGGGAFDVEHVKNMNFGPSVVFGSSCVTGRIDGIHPYNELSQAFLHAGINAYVGATRESWGTIAPLPDDKADEAFGDYLAYVMFGYLTGGVCYDKSDFQITPKVENTTMGVALMLAKNTYVVKMGSDGGGPNDDTVEEFMVHGDPAFNPYEPNHNG